LGPLVGEPAKAAFVRGRVALAPAVTALAIENVLYTLSGAAMIAACMGALRLAPAVTALAIENVLYTLSAAAMIAAGMVALLFRFELPSAIRDVGEIAIAATIALFAIAL